MTPSPLVSEFYERQRRLSYVFAGVCAVILVPALVIGFVVGTFDQPRLVPRGNSLVLLHRATILEKDEKASRLYMLDGSFHVGRRTVLLGEADALLSEGGESTVFFGRKFTVLRDGETLRSGELPQTWDVLDAVEDPVRGWSWIFGWKDQHLVASVRKGGSGPFSETLEIAAGPEPWDLHASIDGARGPLVSWREKKGGSIQAALYGDGRFRPLAGFDVGSATSWTAVLAGPRALVVYSHPEDRNFRSVKLRVRCCAECGLPAPPSPLVFEDPLFFLKRRVTGIAAVARDPGLLLVLTRVAAITWGEIPLGPEARGPFRLKLLSAEPLWRQVLSNVGPLVMLFLSFSLIFLGYGLFRERARAALEKTGSRPSRGLPIAEVMDRVMADILDWIVVWPLVPMAWDLLDVHVFYTLESPVDPRFWLLIILLRGIKAVYDLALEASTGTTLGKWILGLRVAEPDGSRVRLGGALVRNLVRLVELEPIGLVFLATTARRQRLGDLLGGTIVLRNRSETAPSADAGARAPGASGPP